MNDIKDLLGLSKPKYVKCSACRGTGRVKRYPHYSIVMPEKVKMRCETCKGEGEFLVVPDNAIVVREADANRI